MDKRPMLSIEESLNHHFAVMAEIRVVNTWEAMSAQEKATCLNYARHLKNSIVPSGKLIVLMNNIHDKYPEFSVYNIPTNQEVSA
jgi:hypothetical protein